MTSGSIGAGIIDKVVVLVIILFIVIAEIIFSVAVSTFLGVALVSSWEEFSPALDDLCWWGVVFGAVVA